MLPALTAERIYEKFVANNGPIEIRDKDVQIGLKKKRDFPQILEMMKHYEPKKYNWLYHKKLIFYPSATS